MATSIETLLKLSKNPNYKLTPAQVQELEDYRSKEMDRKVKQNSGQFVKADTSINKHDTDLPEEQRKGRG